MSGTPLQTPIDVASEYAALQFVVQQLIGRTATIAVVKVIACTNNGGVSPWGTVDVQPIVTQLTGDQQSVPHGVLYRLPYFRLQGGANAVIIDPQANDIGVAVFAARDISSLKQQSAIDQIKGGQSQGVPPASLRQFSMSDGLYVGGFLNGTPTQYVRFYDGGVEVISPTKVKIEAPEIELAGAVHQTGGADSTFSAKVTATGDVIGQGTSLHTHTHGGVQSGGSNTGPPT